MTFSAAQGEIFNYSDLIIQNGEREIARAYQQAYKQVSNQLKNLYLKIQAEGIPKEEYYNYMTQYKRLERLQDSIRKEYSKAFVQVKNITINNNTAAMTQYFYRSNYLLNWVKDAEQIFVVIDDAVIQASVYGTAQKWSDILLERYGSQKNYIPQANTLLETLHKNNIDNLARIQRTLTQQFIQGTSYTKTARAMQELFGGIAYNSQRVARTEGTRVMNAGNLASTNYARSEGVDIRRKWLASLDGRTRATHGAADGQLEDKNGQFRVGAATGPYPGNMSTAGESVNCRCTVIDVVDGVGPQVRRGTNPLTGESEIIEFTDFDDYMKSNGMKQTAKGWVKA